MSVAHRVVVVATYFGRLPDYFPAWLKSCERNPEFQWLVFSDDDRFVGAYPKNVSHIPIQFGELVAILAQALGHELRPASPYKLCDYKPLYWALVEHVGAQAEFWGHCDLDMVFGDLSSYISEEILGRYDKIFSVGHFTLYRNEPRVNRMFLREHPTVSWRDFVLVSEHRGFDEHIGVNKIWDLHAPKRFYRSEMIIADIDPGVRSFRVIPPNENHKLQIFEFADGRIMRHFQRNGRQLSDEFMYIHFQKRQLTEVQDCNAHAFYIAPAGFAASSRYPDALTAARVLNPQALSLGELGYCLRQNARHLVRVMQTRHR